MAPRKRKQTNVFVVEKILDEKQVEGGRIYLIKWKGFDDSHTCWEPFANIIDKDLIRKFRQERRRMKKLKLESKESVKTKNHCPEWLGDIDKIIDKIDAGTGPIEEKNRFRIGLFSGIVIGFQALVWGIVFLSTYQFTCVD